MAKKKAEEVKEEVVEEVVEVADSVPADSVVAPADSVK